MTMTTTCEDYPCCGHLPGECADRPEFTSAYYLANPAATHLGCDHNTGYCDYEDQYEDEWEEPEDTADEQEFHPDAFVPDDNYASYLMEGQL